MSTTRLRPVIAQHSPASRSASLPGFLTKQPIHLAILALRNLPARTAPSLFATLATLLLMASPARGQYSLQVLDSLTYSQGAYIYGGVTFDSRGNLYGAAEAGGANGLGAIFELSPPSGGSGPWTETTLYSFTGDNDGEGPYDGVVADSAGNLYGTTADGGANGAGVVFELSPPSGGSGPWTETLLYSFTGGNDGGNSYAGLIVDSHGNLYGTTKFGGTDGAGVVFELSPPSGGSGPWTESVLHSFTEIGSDGGYPLAGLIFDSHGNLYGTTYDGGTNSTGTAFELSPPSGGSGPWTETTLYSFTDASNGGYPEAGLVFDSAGNLYGTTYFAGSQGEGTVFELNPPSGGSGPWTETILHSFTGESDGCAPQAGLIFDSKGNLYGTAGSCGSGDGVVFELSPPSGIGPWTETVLHSFDYSDGAYPYGSVIFDAKGNLYGTTYEGGPNEEGVVFELTPSTPTTTALSSMPSASTGGQTVTFTASVGPAPTFTAGLGSVTFKANGITIGTIGLLTADDGVATLRDASLLPSGSPYSVLAFYNPPLDGSLAPSMSSPVMQTVSAEPTTTAIVAGNSSPTFGQSVTLTASVSSTNGVTPAGSVWFKNGATSIGTAALTKSGTGLAQAVLNIATLPAAANSITAIYTGSNYMQASMSSPTTVTVTQATSATTVSSTVNPSVYGQAVSFTATVTPKDGGTPTGTVTFYKNGLSIGVLPLSGGQATLPDTTLTPATYAITATYNGSVNVAGSMGTLAGGQVVGKTASTTMLASAPNPSTSGQTVTLTATVKANSPSTVVPPGAVVLYDTFNGKVTELGVGTLSGGLATLTTSSLAIGTHSITATYTGSAYVQASPASSPVTQTVN